LNSCASAGQAITVIAVTRVSDRESVLLIAT
jgi:hypothetical protein